MKIVIPGGTGQVGRILCRAFASAGDEVVVLSRKANPRMTLGDSLINTGLQPGVSIRLISKNRLNGL
jgi:uncharacterized protein YbjT (DUF2867 family)